MAHASHFLTTRAKRTSDKSYYLGLGALVFLVGYDVIADTTYQHQSIQVEDAYVQEYAAPVPLTSNPQNIAELIYLANLTDIEPAAGSTEAVESTSDAAAAAAPDSFVISHQLKAGETIYRLSKRYNTPVAHIVAANNIQDATNLSVGQTVIIPTSEQTVLSVLAAQHTNLEAIEPAAGPIDIDHTPATLYVTHQVIPGETLYSIAQQYKSSVLDVMLANNLSEPEKLSPDMTLEIPLEYGNVWSEERTASAQY